MVESTRVPIASDDAMRASIREKYGAAATAVLQGSAGSCCGPANTASSCCGGGQVSPIVIGNYQPAETAELPDEAVLASLGCGNPTALARLEAGQVVLDLGSGGGIDVLLSAKRVGPSGFVYGLDMTDQMLALAEQNRVAAGVNNVRFLKGQIEDIPLPDASVDVVISNCVINLSTDKDRVFQEAFRVLRPGGLFAVSDIVTRGTLPADIRASIDAWAGCVAGALDIDDYTRRLSRAGFTDAAVEVTREYDAGEIYESAGCCGSESGCGSPSSGVLSGFVRARKP